jgi:hypothetical protein
MHGNSASARCTMTLSEEVLSELTLAGTRSSLIRTKQKTGRHGDIGGLQAVSDLQVKR